VREKERKREREKEKERKKERETEKQSQIVREMYQGRRCDRSMRRRCGEAEV
jgi:hypothetical protein